MNSDFVNDELSSELLKILDLDLTHVPEDDYGWPYFGDDLPQLQRELFAYSLTRGNWGYDLRKWYLERVGINIKSQCRFLSPFRHLVNAFILQWGRDFALQAGDFKNTFSLRIIEAWCTEDDIALAGSASSAKTYTITGCLMLDWWANPLKTLSIMGTTALGAGEDRCWGSLVELFNSANQRIGEVIDSKKMLVYDVRDIEKDAREIKNAIKLIAIEKGAEGAKAIASTRGRKHSRVRLVFDELAEMDKFVLDARVNLSSNRDFIFCGIGNPKPGANPHTELCTPSHSRGWEAVSKKSKTWRTSTGICVFLNGEESPNFENGADPDNPPFPFLLTKDKLRRILIYCHGNKNSLEYYRNAIGFWPDGSVQLTVISKAQITAAKISDEPEWRIEPFRYLCGLDIPFGYGGDRAVAAFGKIGVTNKGKRVAHLITTKTFFPQVSGPYEDALAELFVAECIKRFVEPRDVGIDVSGDGGKVMAAIMRAWHKIDTIKAVNIFPISSMGTPSEDSVSLDDPRPANKVYDRAVTELWFRANVAVSTRCIFGLDGTSELVYELSSRTYTIKGSKISVEKKEDMKSRLGFSPDEADAFVYFLHMCAKAGLVFASDEKFRPLLPKTSFDRGSRVLSPAMIGRSRGYYEYSEDDWPD